MRSYETSLHVHDAISREEREEVQVSLKIKKKRKSIKGQQMVATSIKVDEKLVERRYSKTEESGRFFSEEAITSSISPVSKLHH